MNPLKIFKESIPSLAKVLESIHAHLEEQLETQQKILKLLEDINGKKICKVQPSDEKDPKNSN